MPGRAAVTAWLTTALAVGLIACGDGDGGESGPQENGAATLTVYSSMPLRGPSAAQAESIINSEKLALEEVGGRIGEFVVKYVSLDDSTGPVGWEPKAVSEAARRAAQDRTTVGYLGDLESGASAISIPVLNEAGILQISPSNTAVGLTRAEGAGKGEPEKYYPSGKRTFGRVIAADNRQAAAQVTLQREAGCTSTFLLNEAEFTGKGIADQIALLGPPRGLTIAGREPVDRDRADVLPIVDKVAQTAPDCVFFGGRTRSNAVALFEALHAALPSAELFGADGVAETAFTGALSPAVQAKVHLTTPALAPPQYPSRGRTYFKRYRARFGRDPEPLGIYGYEAMGLMLQAIRDAGEDADDKEKVVEAFFAIKDRTSVLGTYSIDENGDTTLARYGTATVRNGKPVLRAVVEPVSTK